MVAAGECGRQTLAAVCVCADAGEMVQARTPRALARPPAPHAEPVSFLSLLPSPHYPSLIFVLTILVLLLTLLQARRRTRARPCVVEQESMLP